MTIVLTILLLVTIYYIAILTIVTIFKNEEYSKFEYSNIVIP